MPNNPAYLDQLLMLAGLLGADAAWLLRGCDEANLAWFQDDGTARSLPVHKHVLGRLTPAILIARFPDAGSFAEPEPSELKLPPHTADREIQAAALVSAAVDALSQMGPGPTLRVLEWVFARYGIKPNPWEARDRRPRPPEPAPEPEPATSETTRLDVPADDPPKRRPGRPRKETRTDEGRNP